MCASLDACNAASFLPRRMLSASPSLVLQSLFRPSGHPLHPVVGHTEVTRWQMTYDIAVGSHLNVLSLQWNTHYLASVDFPSHQCCIWSDLLRSSCILLLSLTSGDHTCSHQTQILRVLFIFNTLHVLLHVLDVLHIFYIHVLLYLCICIYTQNIVHTESTVSWLCQCSLMPKICHIVSWSLTMKLHSPVLIWPPILLHMFYCKQTDLLTNFNTVNLQVAFAKTNGGAHIFHSSSVHKSGKHHSY